MYAGCWGGYDQLCRLASPKLLLALDLGLGCDNKMRPTLMWAVKVMKFI